MFNRSLAITLAVALPAIASTFPVLDGSRLATIIHEDGARDEAVRAYRDLGQYLKKATGRDFVAVSERDFKPAAHTHPIFVGLCAALPKADATELRGADRDAYLVHITPTAAYLAGPRPWSTYWAVCQFLEDVVGVRWLIPGPLGEDVLKRASITANESRRLYKPVMRSRLWSGAHYGGVWSLRQRIHGRYRFHHNLLRVFNPGKHYDQHPDWFPLRSGKRYRPAGTSDHGWQPCLATESSVKHGADVARAAWAANPDLESYSYGCNDGQGWCECEGCKAMDRPIEPWDGFEGTYSYRFYGWLNKVAAELEKTDPDKLLGCLAYSTYILPPEAMGLHKNIIPYLTSNRADYYEPKFRGQDQKLLAWWGRVANQMGIYDYAYGMGFAIPRIYNRLFQEAIQHAVKNSVRGFYAEVYPNWGLDGHKLYVMSRVLWNPDVDIDAITGEWMERMFRDAAEPMKKHFALCERTWREQDTGEGHWAYRLAAKAKQFDVFPPKVLSTCTGYLEQAASMAKDDLVRKRIQFFHKTWDVTLLLAGNYWAAKECQALVEKNAAMPDIASALRRMADRTSSVDIDAYIKEKVGGDPIAFHPPKPSWIAPLKGGASTTAKRWCASRLSRAAVNEARKAGELDGPAIRRTIGASVKEVFGENGSDAYRKCVEQIDRMARKIVTAQKVTTPPVIDGRLDDAVWRDADAITGFSRWGQVAPATYTTVARVAHDGRNFYLALDCQQDTSKLKVDASPRDGSTWKDDSVEIFINPTLDEFPYIQFIINAKGAFFDQRRQNDEQTYTECLSANFDCSWAAGIEPQGWTAELRLPLNEFGCAPKDRSSLLRMNLVRNVQGKASEISAWFSSVGAHADPLSRGWVILGER